jgi:predicted phage baseplate assembly protein
MTSKVCGCTTETCGCCESTERLTPLPTANRPGLDALRYRVGTHGALLETMKADLATVTVEALEPDGETVEVLQPLRGLTTRDLSDPAIALLDGWATVGDVLTFYQERIANEGYLRTATERRSVLELARLVGYAPRPGVASTVYLAYTLDDKQTEPVEIPAGARSQSVPGPDELPAAFETSEKLTARSEWSKLAPRMTEPQRITFNGDDPNTDIIYFKGTATQLKPGDPLLFAFSGTDPVLRFVETVEADFPNDRTKVVLQKSALPPSTGTSPVAAVAAVQPDAAGALDSVLGQLALAPSRPPASNALRLPRSLEDISKVGRDTLPQLLTVFEPSIAGTLYPAWANSGVTESPAARVYGFRVKAAPFGSTAPLKPIVDDQGRVVDRVEWPIAGDTTIGIELNNPAVINIAAVSLTPRVVVSITRGGEARRQETGPSLSAGTTTLHLGPDDVDIKTTITDEEATYEFQFPGGETILIKPLSSGGQPVTVHGDTEQTVGMGQTIAYGNATRQVAMSLSGEGAKLRIGVRTPLPPAPLDVVYLDAEYDEIVLDSWAVIVRPPTKAAPDDSIRPLRVTGTQMVAKVDYGITAKSTRLKLDKEWLTQDDRYLSVLRETTVFAQSEEFQLAERPYQPDAKGNVADVKGKEIELARLYDGLTSGRWIIVSGERTDVKSTSGATVTGIKASELVMLAGVNQSHRPELPGDKIHSMLILAKDLEYSYKRDTVTIYGNVVKATHGETRNEIMGSGDASRGLQSFELKQPPLTFVPAPKPSGADSTLKVYVNEVAWEETDTLAGLGPAARKCVLKIEDDGKTSVIFGTGKAGARLPTGVANVKAVYRNGIGKPGNVNADQISLLLTRPLGVKSVINPLRASGGADKESRDDARENAPLAVMSLDRLVSIQDYGDFTRTFAGIGKAQARRLSDGHRQLVHITIAGADDIPIDQDSDLYRNLLLALRRFGDPSLPVRVEPRELVVLVLSANVRIKPNNLWEPVVTALRIALLDRFGFQKRSLGQPVLLSQVISLMQSVRGVAYVDVDAFGGIPEKQAQGGGKRTLLSLGEMADAVKSILNPPPNAPPAPAPRVDANLADVEQGGIRPAQLAIFTPAVPDTLILNPIP